MTIKMQITFYWIAYFITFVIGYFFMYWIAQKSFLAKFPNLQLALKTRLDDLALLVLLGLLVWGRIWYFVPLGWDYFLAHWVDLFKIWQGWMAFVGWAIGVTLWVLLFAKLNKLSFWEFLVLMDLIVLIVPVGIFLGRLGNFFNQEIVGVPVENLSLISKALLEKFGLTYSYSWWGEGTRININFLEALGEGIFVGLILYWIFFKKYKTNPQPWMLTAIFLVVYGMVRFFLEFWKYYDFKIWGDLSLAQMFMIGFIIIGILLYKFSSRYEKAS